MKKKRHNTRHFYAKLCIIRLISSAKKENAMSKLNCFNSNKSGIFSNRVQPLPYLIVSWDTFVRLRNLEVINEYLKLLRCACKEHPRFRASL